MTFNPKTFFQDCQSAQKYVERAVGFAGAAPGLLSSYDSPTVSFLSIGETMTISNKWSGGVEVKGTNLEEMVEELKRRMGFQQTQEQRLRIEGKANE